MHLKPFFLVFTSSIFVFAAELSARQVRRQKQLLLLAPSRFIQRIERQEEEAAPFTEEDFAKEEEEAREDYQWATQHRTVPDGPVPSASLEEKERLDPLAMQEAQDAKEFAKQQRQAAAELQKAESELASMLNPKP